MAFGSRGLRMGIQIVLALLIVGLAYFLWYSITEPYERVERQQEITEMTRQRMSTIRTALIQYERDSTSFPDSLDNLIAYIQQDSSIQANYDSIIGVPPESLLYSPRTGNRFQYTVNDTGRVEVYLLQDPDSDDQIGTLEPDPTQTNVANWE